MKKNTRKNVDGVRIKHQLAFALSGEPKENIFNHMMVDDTYETSYSETVVEEFLSDIIDVIENVLQAEGLEN